MLLIFPFQNIHLPHIYTIKIFLFKYQKDTVQFKFNKFNLRRFSAIKEIYQF